MQHYTILTKNYYAIEAWVLLGRLLGQAGANEELLVYERNLIPGDRRFINLEWIVRCLVFILR